MFPIVCCTVGPGTTGYLFRYQFLSPPLVLPVSARSWELSRTHQHVVLAMSLVGDAVRGIAGWWVNGMMLERSFGTGLASA